MLNRLAKAARRLPVAVAIITTAAVASVGTAYALTGTGDEGTVTIEQVASEPTATDSPTAAPTTDPAAVATSEPAPVGTGEPAAEPVTDSAPATSEPVPSETTTPAPAPAPEETSVPKPAEPIAPDDPIRQTAPPPDLGSGDSYVVPAPEPEPSN